MAALSDGTLDPGASIGHARDVPGDPDERDDPIQDPVEGSPMTAPGGGYRDVVPDPRPGDLPDSLPGDDPELPATS